MGGQSLGPSVQLLDFGPCSGTTSLNLRCLIAAFLFREQAAAQKRMETQGGMARKVPRAS